MSCSRWLSTCALALILATVASVSEAQAQPDEKGALGVGIVLGVPTGVAAKLYLQDDTAVAAAVGFDLLEGGLHLHGDFLLHPWVLEDTEDFVLPAYVGAGLRVLDEDRGNGNDVFHLGLRAVGGMLFDFREIPIDVFVELAGIIDYAFTDVDGGLGIGLNASLGARYYF